MHATIERIGEDEMITPEGINGIAVHTATQLSIFFEDLARDISKSPLCTGMSSDSITEEVVKGLIADPEWIRTNFKTYLNRIRTATDNSSSVR